MKYLFVFALVAVVACKDVPQLNLSDAYKLQLREYAGACIKDVGGSADLAEKLREGKFSDDKIFKDFLLCFLDKRGFLDSDGLMKVDTIISKYPEDFENKEAVRSTITECNKTKGSDRTETAYTGYKCYRDNAPFTFSL